MASLLKNGNIKTYVYLVLVVLLALAWRGGDAVGAKLDAKSFYPVWIKQAAAMSAEQAADVDALFKKHEEVKPVEIAPPKPVEPDYGEMLKYRVELAGVADNGAFINGQFYKVGAKINDLTYVTMSGASVTPVLWSVKKDAAILLLGKKSITVAVKTE